MAIISVKI